MTTPADQLAREIASLKRRITALERAPRLKNASIESATLPVYDANQTLRQVIGAQPDGTYTITDVNGPPPPVPTQPLVEARPGTLVVTWGGTFLDDVPAPADFDHVEVHVSTESGYIPTDDTQVAAFTSLKGGSVTLALDAVPHYIVLQAVSTSLTESTPSVEVSGTPLPAATGAGGVKTYHEEEEPVGLGADDDGALWYDTNDGNHPYRWDGSALAWVSIQDAAIGQAQQTADDALAAATTDGLPPASSPGPLTLAGIGMFLVKWTPIANHDPVTYEVHVSETLGFTPDATTLVGQTNGSQFTVRALPGPEPAPGQPDPRTLDYDATYYVRIVAKDEDGAADPSAQQPATVFRVTGVDLAADSVTADNIVAGTLTGDLFAATVIVAGTFRTADTGQRVEWGIAGIKGYKANGDLMVSFPTADGEEALFDGEMIARGLTVLGGASFQSGENEITADGVLTLMRGIVSPSATPTISVDYDKVQVSTASLTAAQKTNNDPDWGLGGPFDLVPSEISCIEWRSTVFACYQTRPNGTRCWYLNVSGQPTVFQGVYYHDFKNWEIWSATEITNSSVPAKNGHYVMFRHMVGAGTDYYLSAPQGINRYSRQNGIAPPAIGTDGNDVFVAEVINTDDLLIRYFVPDGSGNNLAAPFSTVQSSTGYAAAVGMCAVGYSPTGYDIGAGRYMSAQRGNSSNVRLLTISAGGIYPGGTGNNWASPNIDAETFEAPTTNRRGIAWDGTQFWSLHSDGYLYKHTSERWDPAVASSTYWAKVTFYDDVGTTHETTPGSAKSYVAKRRAKNTFIPPDIPDNGGVDDPKKARLYMARGAAPPGNSAYHLQATVAPNTTYSFTTLATLSASPPTINSFPASNPAKIRNDDDTLVISGDGTIKIGGKNVAVGAPSRYVITASGTWTPPPGLKAAYVEIQGGSGGSGGIGSAGSGQAESGSGGAGAYCAKWYLAGDFNATESITIGAAGNAGSASGTTGNNATAGGSTVFKGMTAGPGGGGNGVTGTTGARAVAGTTPGGTGGVAVGGDININGQDGASGRWFTSLAVLAAVGGDSQLGKGGSPRNGQQGANQGTGYGGGAGAAFTATITQSGAAGLPGICIITCYF